MTEANDASRVMIIGAGPSGLMAAVELARRGVMARVIERERTPPHEARATALQPATLEILANAGVVSDVLLSSVHLRYARLFDAELGITGETDLETADAGCPWPFQCSLPQWRTEQILADRLAELGGSVERGVAAAALRETANGVLIDLEHADGSTETAKAAWVIGAGGAHSVTRRSMTEELAGETYPGTALVADIGVRCGLPRDGSALIASPGGYILLAPLPGGRWLTFIGDLTDNEAERLTTSEAAATHADASHSSVASKAAEHHVAAVMARRVPSHLVDVTDVRWAAAFRMHKRITPNLADGRRFLMGDAGHLSSPFGGEGLNSGLQDAHNLAWKLALELAGRARAGLLDTYAAERGAAARRVLEVSDRLHALVREAVGRARNGGAATPKPSPDTARALVRARCMLDVSYAGSPLTGEFPPPANDSQPADDPVSGLGERYPGRAALTGTGHHLLVDSRPDGPALDRLRHRWAGLVEVFDSYTGNGAVLVRPDGFLGFRAAAADAAGLAAVDAHLGSYMIPA